MTANELNELNELMDELKNIETQLEDARKKAHKALAEESALREKHMKLVVEYEETICPVKNNNGSCKGLKCRAFTRNDGLCPIFAADYRRVEECILKRQSVDCEEQINLFQ